MSSYPTIGLFEAPQVYSYRPPAPNNATIDCTPDIETIPVTVDSQAHPMTQLAEELDHPTQSAAFLTLYQKSHKKVEALAGSLQKASVGLGLVGVVCFTVAIGSFLTSSVQAIQQSNTILEAQNKKLGAGLGSLNIDELLDVASGNVSISAVSSTFSMFMWGLVMAKAKTGFTASFSKDLPTVRSAFKSAVGIIVLLAVAGLAKLNADNHYIENWTNNAPVSGQNLMSQPTGAMNLAQVSVSSSDLIDQYDQALTQLNELWNAQKMKVKNLNIKDPLAELYAKASDQATKIISVFEQTDSEEEPVAVKTQQKTVNALSPEDLKAAMSKVVSLLGVIFAGGCAVTYVSLFVQYKNALSRHDKLNTLLNHPMARVASGEQVARVAQQVQAIKEEEEANNANLAIQRLLALQQGKTVTKKIFQAPTLQNLPPKKLSAAAAYQYSLCESIDYQTESLLPKAAPQNNMYSLEQVQALLNQQRNELSRPQIVAPKPVIFQSAPPQAFAPAPIMQAQPQVVVMTKKEYQQKFGKVPTAQVMTEVIEPVVVENSSMKITHSNFMA